MWRKKHWLLMIWAVWAMLWTGIAYFHTSTAASSLDNAYANSGNASQNPRGETRPIDDDGQDRLPIRARATLPTSLLPTTDAAIKPTIVATTVPTPLPQPTLTTTPLRIFSKLPPEPVAPQPTLSPEGVNRSVRVPILMYHYISVPPNFQDQLRVNLSVPPDQLESHLKFLKEGGYHALSLYDLHDHLINNTPLPAKPIILTFDDGYRDHYENAFPLLKKYDMIGTFFVFTDPIFQNHPSYLTWDMARAMAAAGMDIESHTKTHPDLRNRNNDFLSSQIYTPIDAITEQIGKRPRFFAYPAGQYDTNTLRVLTEAQTWGAVTTRWGATHAIADSLTWTRLRINYGVSASEFGRLIN